MEKEDAGVVKERDGPAGVPALQGSSSGAGRDKELAQKDAPAPASPATRTKDDLHYKNIMDSKQVSRLLNKPFDAAVWRKWFGIYAESGDKEAQRAMRLVVQEGTISACNKNSYTLADGEKVKLGSKEELAKHVRSCCMYDYKAQFEFSFPATYGETTIEVIESDCLEAAIHLKLQRGMNPAVLNMASHKRPGGGYKNGSGAQEENLFRRSNYFQFLEDPQKIDKKRKWKYPLPEFGGVYSPKVTVFRESEDRGYGFMRAPEIFDFIAVAAYARPQLIGETKKVLAKKGRSHSSSSGGKKKQEFIRLLLAPKFADKTKRKIRVILAIGLENGHDSLVLSAFGCGAFGNPPGHIAQLFKEVITQEFNGCYKHITFAIYDDHNARNKHNPEGNLLPFQKVFGPLQPLPRGRKSHGMYSGDDADDENSTDTCTGSESDTNPGGLHKNVIVRRGEEVVQEEEEEDGIITDNETDESKARRKHALYRPSEEDEADADSTS